MLCFCRVFGFEQGRRHPSIQEIIDTQAGRERAILAAGVYDLADMGECPLEGGLKAKRDFRGPVVRQMHDALGAAHGHLSFHEFVNIKGGNEGAAGGSFACPRQVWQNDHVLAGEQVELLSIA